MNTAASKRGRREKAAAGAGRRASVTQKKEQSMPAHKLWAVSMTYHVDNYNAVESGACMAGIFRTEHEALRCAVHANIAVWDGENFSDIASGDDLAYLKEKPAARATTKQLRALLEAQDEYVESAGEFILFRHVSRAEVTNVAFSNKFDAKARFPSSARSQEPL